MDEGMVAGGDGGPAARLRVGRRFEARPEPVADGGREGRERIGDDGMGHGALSVAPEGHFDQMFTRADGRASHAKWAEWPIGRAGWPFPANVPSGLMDDGSPAASTGRTEWKGRKQTS